MLLSNRTLLVTTVVVLLSLVAVGSGQSLLFVDEIRGSDVDDNDCLNTPCASLSHAVSQVTDNGDIIRIVGALTEVLEEPIVINKPIAIEGDAPWVTLVTLTSSPNATGPANIIINSPPTGFIRENPRWLDDSTTLNDTVYISGLTITSDAENSVRPMNGGILEIYTPTRFNWMQLNNGNAIEAGGCIYVGQDDETRHEGTQQVRLDAVTFNECSARTGGGLASVSDDTLIVGASDQFTNCHAMNMTPDEDIDDYTIYGGCMAITGSGSKAELSYSSCSDSSSEGIAGGVYIGLTASMSPVDFRINGNKAALNGGGATVDGAIELNIPETEPWRDVASLLRVHGNEIDAADGHANLECGPASTGCLNCDECGINGRAFTGQCTLGDPSIDPSLVTTNACACVDAVLTGSPDCACPSHTQWEQWSTSCYGSLYMNGVSGHDELDDGSVNDCSVTPCLSIEHAIEQVALIPIDNPLVKPYPWIYVYQGSTYEPRHVLVDGDVEFKFFFQQDWTDPDAQFPFHFQIRDNAKMMITDTLVHAVESNSTYGGAFLVDGPGATLLLERVILTNNYADYGGAVALLEGEVFIWASTLNNNGAAMQGGALFVSGGNSKVHLGVGVEDVAAILEMTGEDLTRSGAAPKIQENYVNSTAGSDNAAVAIVDGAQLRLASALVNRNEAAGLYMGQNTAVEVIDFVSVPDNWGNLYELQGVHISGNLEEYNVVCEDETAVGCSPCGACAVESGMCDIADPDSSSTEGCICLASNAIGDDCACPEGTVFDSDLDECNNVIFVDEGQGSNVESCGGSQTPCKTLQYGLTRGLDGNAEFIDIRVWSWMEELLTDDIVLYNRHLTIRPIWSNQNRMVLSNARFEVHEGASLTMIDIELVGGVGEFGGCVHVNGTDSKFTGSNVAFTNCHSTNSGGAIAVDNGGAALLDRFEFVGCSAEHSGGCIGVYGPGSNIELESYPENSFSGPNPYLGTSFSYLQNCTAEHWGGGLYVGNGAYAKLGEHVALRNNYAAQGGGGLAVDGETSLVSASFNVYATGNTASGETMFDNPDAVEVMCLNGAGDDNGCFECGGCGYPAGHCILSEEARTSGEPGVVYDCVCVEGAWLDPFSETCSCPWGTTYDEASGSCSSATFNYEQCEIGLNSVQDAYGKLYEKYSESEYELRQMTDNRDALSNEVTALLQQVNELEHQVPDDIENGVCVRLTNGVSDPNGEEECFCKQGYVLSEVDGETACVASTTCPPCDSGLNTTPSDEPTIPTWAIAVIALLIMMIVIQLVAARKRANDPPMRRFNDESEGGGIEMNSETNQSSA